MDEPVTERQVAAQAAATDEKTLNLSISDHPPELGKILLFQVGALDDFTKRSRGQFDSLTLIFPFSFQQIFHFTFSVANNMDSSEKDWKGNLKNLKKQDFIYFLFLFLRI